jgi:hypothetical protein
LRSELHAINEQIVELERRNTITHRKELENRLDLKRKELESHEKAKPPAVSQPDQDSELQKGAQTIAAKIGELLAQRKQIDQEIETAKVNQTEYALRSARVEKALSKLAGFRQQSARFISELEADCQSLGVEVTSLVSVTINEKPLENKHKEITAARASVDSMLDATQPNSIVSRRVQIAADIRSLQDQLDEPNRRYQGYLRELEAWESHEKELIGDDTTVGSAKFLEKQLADLGDIPKQIIDECNRRVDKAKAIHREITQLAGIYRTLYAPVQDFIDQNPIARERFRLNFEVAIETSGFEDVFSSYINHAVAGTFAGVDEGSREIRTMLRRHDVGTEAGIVAFLNDVIESLQRDKRAAPAPPVRIAAQLRKGQSLVALYDYVFALEYVRPRYRLKMGEKELSQLSPGERGTLLLVFYLLIDKEQIPLVIDQPEENLDNQTVFELLVPCIKRTKERRQMIIVTHNPNLAVVCDAEQIVCADLNKAINHEMKYLTGAIENPSVNKAIVDILEGTRPAFDNRDSKYEVSA